MATNQQIGEQGLERHLGNPDRSPTRLSTPQRDALRVDADPQGERRAEGLPAGRQFVQSGEGVGGR